MKHQLRHVGTDTEVVDVAVELRLVTCTTDVLIHGRELDIGFGDEVINGSSGHIQNTVFACAVTIEEIVAQTQLQLTMNKTAHLRIATPVVVAVVDFPMRI